MKFSILLIALLATSKALFAETVEPSRNFRAAKIVKSVPPDFPPGLYLSHRNGGTVNLILALDEEGKLCDALVTASTAPGFSEVALEAIRHWKFAPAQIESVPVATSFPLTFSFQVRGVIYSTDWADATEPRAFALLDDENSCRLCTPRELDRIPSPIRTVVPSYPKALADAGLSGDVTVEFYIDEQGAVRMPSVIGLPARSLADLAVDAVRQWAFEPPTREGRPTLVRIRQTFFFNDRSTKS